jgi:hypothetical protein
MSLQDRIAYVAIFCGSVGVTMVLMHWLRTR